MTIETGTNLMIFHSLVVSTKYRIIEVHSGENGLSFFVKRPYNVQTKAFCFLLRSAECGLMLHSDSPGVIEYFFQAGMGIGLELPIRQSDCGVQHSEKFRIDQYPGLFHSF